MDDAHMVEVIKVPLSEKQRDFTLMIASYRPLGEKWEAMGGTWGGRFSHPDGNHFSLEHEGVR
jgi:hypothetical protein